MIYVYLGLAIVFEAGWAIAMKLSSGLTRPAPTIVFGVLYILSAVFLALATKKMDVGVAYAIWAGAGIALIAAAGMTYFQEPVTAAKLAFTALIVVGVVGLQVYGGGH
jgi:multidrug transporter EmrE-like cation transporter